MKDEGYVKCDNCDSLFPQEWVIFHKKTACEYNGKKFCCATCAGDYVFKLAQEARKEK